MQSAWLKNRRAEVFGASVVEPTQASPAADVEFTMAESVGGARISATAGYTSSTSSETSPDSAEQT